MSKISDSFFRCYLVQFSYGINNTLDVYDMRAMVEITNSRGGLFLGPESGTPFGIKLAKSATHVGVVDFSDEENPLLIHAFCFEDIQPKTLSVVSVDKYYFIFKKHTKNFSFIISQYKSFSDQYKNDRIKQHYL